MLVQATSVSAAIPFCNTFIPLLINQCMDSESLQLLQEYLSELWSCKLISVVFSVSHDFSFLFPMTLAARYLL